MNGNGNGNKPFAFGFACVDDRMVGHLDQRLCGAYGYNRVIIERRIGGPWQCSSEATKQDRDSVAMALERAVEAFGDEVTGPLPIILTPHTTCRWVKKCGHRFKTPETEIRYLEHQLWEAEADIVKRKGLVTKISLSACITVLGPDGSLSLRKVALKQS